MNTDTTTERAAIMSWLQRRWEAIEYAIEADESLTPEQYSNAEYEQIVIERIMEAIDKGEHTKEQS